MTQHPAPDKEAAVIQLFADDISVERRQVEGETVRLTVKTKTREHLVDEPLTRQQVEIERIPIGRTIDAAPPIRTEGDIIIIPVVEEIVVVERRLMLKEEVILRRVRTSERHRERVDVREQEAEIERIDQRAKMSKTHLAPRFMSDDFITPSRQGSVPMTDETIVAVYDTAAEAAAAVRDLENAGIPSSAISTHAKNGMGTADALAAEAPARKPGFWASLFGGEPEHKHDSTVYDRSLENGSTVVTVKVPEQYLGKAMEVLERYNPVDIDERASGYEAEQMDAPLASATAVPIRTDSDLSADDQTLQLAEETLAVGKRAINRGTTRIRRYVVETPVEEQVNLRRETVAVERRPVTDGRPVTDANFTDKVVEMTESDEEAVVAKTARVKEELVIHKDATDRTETVRDTVRREDAEITKEADGGSTAGTSVTRPAMDPGAAKI